MAETPQVNVRLSNRTVERLKQIQAEEDFMTITEAARAMILRGLLEAERDTNSAWLAGFETGRAEGVAVVLRATQAVMKQVATEFSTFRAALDGAVDDLERLAARRVAKAKESKG